MRYPLTAVPPSLAGAPQARSIMSVPRAVAASPAGAPGTESRARRTSAVSPATQARPVGAEQGQLAGLEVAEAVREGRRAEVQGEEAAGERVVGQGVPAEIDKQVAAGERDEAEFVGLAAVDECAGGKRAERKGGAAVDEIVVAGVGLARVGGRSRT